MPVISEASAGAAEDMKWRRPRNQFISHLISETDPTPQIPSIIQSTRCKSTLSSLLLSTFSNNNNASNETTHASGHNRKKKEKKNTTTTNNNDNNFSATSFRGLGCTAGASQQVSVPAVIRSSADWQVKKARKKKQRRNNSGKNSNSKTCHGVVVDGPSHVSAPCVGFQDVWCGPGIGFSADAAASVDCVVARKNVSARGKLDVEKITHRERPSYLGRRTVNPESFSFQDDDHDPDIFTARPASESFGNARYHHHVRHPSNDGLAEIMIIQGRILVGGRLNSHDQFRDWRLDVDNMSYEQLLELGEKIGYVNTGLKEDEIGLNIKKIKPVILNHTSTHQIDKKCSICQEEYEGDDELGRLDCEHIYHFHCIQQWLVQKNFCPVCKKEVVVRH